MISRDTDSKLTELLRGFIIDGREFNLETFQAIHEELGRPFGGQPITAQTGIELAKMYIHKLFEQNKP